MEKLESRLFQRCECVCVRVCGGVCGESGRNMGGVILLIPIGTYIVCNFRGEYGPPALLLIRQWNGFRFEPIHKF